MNAKHTPGPWQINHHKPFQVCDADGEVRGCSPIAVMHGSVAEKTYNARLIAAAPELLAALETSLQMMIVESYDLNSDWADGIAEIRAAIVKAKGE